MGGRPLKYLLDTHTLMWAVDAPGELSPKARRLLLDGRNHPLGVSAISSWEIAQKVAAGKLRLAKPVADWIAEAARPPFVAILPVDEKVAVESTLLPGSFHKDPADRMIVATARLHGLTVLTKDADLRRYAHVRTLWD